VPISTHKSIKAILGPTNTGKTFLAMERLLGHPTGMIGFPLRLLARENYERALSIKGADNVALITGEEKIIPPHARYFICTVESMPVDRPVSFLAVDEIQLAADQDRGHVFTDRLLHARGQIETIFLGAETIRSLLRRLVPDIVFETRPRFSKLSYSGQKKLTRLPRRSAVVAFSASEVYGIADLIRRQRGGAAVVMGALSPRTRNAQVELYQSGEVDYLVATDAIGMGLNMDVDHVAFASLTKFDGRAPRNLSAPELAQIAGRAGRHMNDGTFGTTADASQIDPEDLSRIESHNFEPIKKIQWRNTDLGFMTIQSLLKGLRKSPPKPGLLRPPIAEDQLILEMLATDAAVSDRAKGQERVRLLWDVAQVPDFRKLRTEFHSRLLAQVYLQLTEVGGRIPESWVAAQVKVIDKHNGDIHAIMDRIAAIRIWTYLANRSGWVENAIEWQAQTRSIEDRLSDTLHQKLTAQFVDRRTSHLMKKLKSDEKLNAVIDDDGVVKIDGHFIGQVEGLTFKAAITGYKAADRAVANAANAVIAPELSSRVQQQLAAKDEAFSLDDQGRIVWQGVLIARLSAGTHPLKPKLEVEADARLGSREREDLKRRLESWLQSHIEGVLPALKTAESAELSAAARGLMYSMTETLGALDRKDAEAQIEALTEGDLENLARIGVRFGLNTLYIPSTLKRYPVRLRAILWTIYANPEEPFLPPPPGRVSFQIQGDVPADFYWACGYRLAHGMAYRVDMIERFSSEVRRLLRKKVHVLPPEQLSPLGITAEKALDLLKALGFAASLSQAGLSVRLRKKNQKHRKKPFEQGSDKSVRTQSSKPYLLKSGDKPFDPDSPFAKLKDLVIS